MCAVSPEAGVGTHAGRPERKDDNAVCDVLNSSLHVQKTISKESSHPSFPPKHPPAPQVRKPRLSPFIHALFPRLAIVDNAAMNTWVTLP